MGNVTGHNSVLVVEDNEDLVIGLQDFLRHDGYAVTVADTVAGAIKLVRSSHFNAILLDLGLPDGDGLEVLQEARRMDPTLPVVIVTAHISHDRTVGSLKEGAFAYLTKPYDREELRHTLRRAIGVKELVVKVERTEHLLSQSEERFHSLVSNLPGAVYRCACDSDWTMEFLSDPIEQLCGYPASDFLASRVRSYSSLIHPNDRQMVERVVLGAVAQRRPYAIEYRLLHKDGGIRWVYEKGQGIFAADGQVLWLDGAIFDITERKRTEETRARLAAIVESSDNAIISQDLNGVITSWNQGAQRLFGYTAQEAIGRPVSILIPQDREDKDPRILERITRGESTDHYETVRRRKDGSLVDVSLIVSPIKDAQGQVIGASKIAHDITERKRMETALKASETRFRAIFDQTFQFIGLMKTDGTVIEANRSALQFAGIREEDVLGKSFWDTPWWTHSPELQNRLREAVRQAAGGTMVRFEATHPSPTGKLAFVDFSLKPVRDEHGNVTLLIPEGRDITERKRAEEEGKESEERYRQLAEHISEVFWMTDPAKQHMLYISPAYEDIWERSCESLYASPQSWLDAIHPEDRARILDASLRKQVVGTYDEQYRILRPDGAVRWISDRAFPIRDSSGIVHRIVGLAGDITDQVRIREFLRTSEERLELVIQGSHDGFWDGRFLSDEPWNSPRTPVWFSPRFKTMLGYTDEEFPDVLESWAARLHPKDTDRVFAALTAHIEHRDPYDVEYRLLTKAGEYGWFRARGQAIWNDAGRVVRMAGSLQDVTDRKLAEHALRRSEQLLQDIINNTTAVIYVKDTDGRYLLVNQRFEQLFSLATDQIIGHTDHEMFPKDIADAFRANDVAVLERNRAMEYEEYAPHPDGLHTYISIKFPLCDHTGKPYATAGISTDITERKRIEDELHASDRRRRLAMTAEPVRLWDWDLRTGQLYWSQEVDTLLGMTPGSARGTQSALLALVYPDDREPLVLAMRHAMESPHADVRFEHRVLQPDGSVQWCIWTGKTIRDQNGKALHVLGTVRATAGSNP